MIGSFQPAASPTSTTPGANGSSVQAVVVEVAEQRPGRAGRRPAWRLPGLQAMREGVEEPARAVRPLEPPGLVRAHSRRRPAPCRRLAGRPGSRSRPRCRSPAGRRPSPSAPSTKRPANQWCGWSWCSAMPAASRTCEVRPSAPTSRRPCAVDRLALVLEGDARARAGLDTGDVHAAPHLGAGREPPRRSGSGSAADGRGRAAPARPSLEHAERQRRCLGRGRIERLVVGDVPRRGGGRRPSHQQVVEAERAGSPRRPTARSTRRAPGPRTPRTAPAAAPACRRGPSRSPAPSRRCRRRR